MRCLLRAGKKELEHYVDAMSTHQKIVRVFSSLARQQEWLHIVLMFVTHCFVDAKLDLLLYSIYFCIELLLSLLLYWIYLMT